MKFIEEQPLVAGLYPWKTGEFCWYCFKPLSAEGVEACQDCTLSVYCSDNCAKTDGLHKDSGECKLFQTYGADLPENADEICMILRLAKLIPQLDTVLKQRYEALMTHRDEILKDAHRKPAVEKILEVIAKILGPQAPKFDDILNIYGRIIINSLELKAPDSSGIGQAVYPLFAKMDHSCDPHVRVIWSGRTAQILPVKTDVVVPPDCTNFSHIRISYIDSTLPKAIRLRMLKDKYYFLCDCPSCTDETKEAQWSGIKCEQAGCMGTLSEATNECYKCHAKASDAFATNGKKFRDEALKLFETYYIDGNELDMTKINEMLPKLKEFFHSNSAYSFHLTKIAMNYAVTNERHEEAFGLATQFEPIYSHVANAANTRLMNPYYAIWLIEFGKLALGSNDFEKAGENFELAHVLLEGRLGADHPITKYARVWDGVEED